MAFEANNGIAPTSQGAGWLNIDSRVFCPVITCPESSDTSRRHFRDFNSIKNHLNEHVTGHLSGAVPLDFLQKHNYSLCSICDKILHTRYKGVCPKCRPAARAQEQMEALRSNVFPAGQNPSPTQQSLSAQERIALPSLADIYGKFVLTLRNIPVSLRSLWAQCLKKSLALAVWHNNEASWAELQMLAKCTLCQPPRAGKSHKSKRLNWTRNRLLRWLNGERTELWNDLQNSNRPQPKQVSTEISKS